MILATVLALVAVAPAMSNASVKAVADCGVGHAAKRPSNFYFYCGDNGMYATSLSWRSWGGKKAKGFGKITYKLCKPSCAMGGYKTKRGKITLSRKVRCGKHSYRYSRLRAKAYGGPTVRVRLQTC
jgi:hypothetical protein